VRWLQAETPTAALVTKPKVVLFVFVEWSKDAYLGRAIVEQAEQRWVTEYPEDDVSWWAGDFSDSPSPLDSWVDWLATQEARLSSVVSMGGGALIWVRRGAVVTFTVSASQLGVEGVLKRTEESLGG